MDAILRREKEQEKNKRMGMIVSAIFHIILLLLFILNLWTYPDPPPGQEGILVSFGQDDFGNSDNNPYAEEENYEEIAEAQEVEEVQAAEEAPSESTPVTETKVTTAENSDEIALKKKKEAERKKAEEEAKKKAEAEAKKKAEEEARKKAKEDAKSKIGNPFGNKTDGSGTGDGDKPGNSGSPTGDPNSGNPGTGGTGNGNTGTGVDLEGRSVVSKPAAPRNPTNEKGKVVIKVCVDRNGNVISADYTLKGSRITDGRAISVAEENARKFKFSANDMAADTQCGFITYNFDVN